MARRRKAPEIDGFVGSTVFVGTWLRRPGQSWDYHHPSDCRPLSLRVAVHLWDQGEGSTVRAIEGDGRTPSFRTYETINLPADATEEQAAEAARGLCARWLSKPPKSDASVKDRVAAGQLVNAGFMLDDFYGAEAWLKPDGMEGFTWFVRGAPEALFAEIEGEQVALPYPGELDPDMPCEVGINHELDHGRTTTVAPCLDDAIRIVEERRLPYPARDEERVIPFEELLRGPKP